MDTEEFLLTVAEVLTQGPSTLPKPLGEREFYAGYRERLEHKLRHKLGQIQRTERLLVTLPEEQKPAFTALLEEARTHRTQIQKELDDLYELLKQYSKTALCLLSPDSGKIAVITCQQFCWKGNSS